ncbi:MULTISPECIES: hypothetical protein [unclassified Streptomyces]|uniref:hypothetical protein n=1 Tax=unclassified Streptomyces TaxID=2593676 RepID=UPI0036EAB5CD
MTEVARVMVEADPGWCKGCSLTSSGGQHVRGGAEAALELVEAGEAVEGIRRD